MDIIEIFNDEDETGFAATKKGNEYTMIYGNEAPVTVVAELNDVDKENIFVGLFTSRCIGVDYTNVKLIVK